MGDRTELLRGSDVADPRLHRALRILLANVELPVLPLVRIIASKRAAGRPKDCAILSCSRTHCV
jgi:hypothetical protein